MGLSFFEKTVKNAKSTTPFLFTGLIALLVGLLTILLSRPLAIGLKALAGVLFIIISVFLIVTVLTIYMGDKENSNKKRLGTFAALALASLVLGIVILSTQLIDILIVIAVSVLLFVEGAANLLFGIELLKKRLKKSWYFLIDGGATVISAIVIMIVVLALLCGGSGEAAKQVAGASVLLIFLGIKMILFGCSMLLISFAVKRRLAGKGPYGDEVVIEDVKN